MSPVFYNVQHAPIGAFASFTLGEKGARGGLGLELGRPANQSIYLGLEDHAGEAFHCLPFFADAEDQRARFDVEGTGAASTVGCGAARLRAFPDEAVSRELTPSRDVWRAGDLEFQIQSPVCPAPDPRKKGASARRLAYVPAVTAELTLDNRRGERPRRFCFGLQTDDPREPLRRLDDDPAAGHNGIGQGTSLAIACADRGVVSALGFTAETILQERYLFNYNFGVGNTGLLIGTVPAGKKRTFRFAICFYRGGIVTTGLKASYHYARLFPNVDAVAAYVLRHFNAVRDRGKAFDRRWAKSGLNENRRWMLAHAIHSYYGSTQLLTAGHKPLWVVNEGEYRMINTFDLTVDQLFFEMALNPWTVANVLDWYRRRYSYCDKLRFPGQAEELPGGLGFTHDMGVANHFTKPGHSVYEKTGLTGCFSHMTHEELVNALACGLVYAHGSGDRAWLRKNRRLFTDGLDSLLRRDHPDPEKRDGIMSLDSSRCSGGGEITTYDSLDVSLGQARHNLYLAVKCWGLYVGLEALFTKQKDKRRARVCTEQARRAASTITAAADTEGVLPAVLFENVRALIIPAVEGLVFPAQLGLKKALREDGPYGELISVLKRHLTQVLRPGVCLFPDGGWKISSTSDNSWLSKIYLCQHVAEAVLGLDDTEAMARADAAHAAWLQEPANTYWAWSDQMVNGIARGSKYYPRGVTAILWMQ